MVRASMIQSVQPMTDAAARTPSATPGVVPGLRRDDAGTAGAVPERCTGARSAEADLVVSVGSADYAPEA